MRNVPMHKKVEIVRGWPARMDQELRQQFGEALRPHTYFDKEAKMYKTNYVAGYGSPESDSDPSVDQFIAGFMACVSMVTE